VLAWLGALTFIVIGVVLLMNSTDQLKTYAILGAVCCLVYAGGVWVTLMAIAEGSRYSLISHTTSGRLPLNRHTDDVPRAMVPVHCTME
jgi:hypothetical protein